MGHGGYKRRQYFLIVCVVLQFLVMWFLGFSRDYRPTSLFGLSSSSSFDKFAFPKATDRDIPIVQKKQNNEESGEKPVKTQKSFVSEPVIEKEVENTKKKRIIIEDDEEEEEEPERIEKKPKVVTKRYNSQQQNKGGGKKKIEDV